MTTLGCALLLAFQAPAPPTVLVVTGVGGEPAYSVAFVRQAEELIGGLQHYGVPAARITWLAEDSTRSPGRVAGRASKARIEQEVAAAVAAASRTDRLLLVFIGHGSDQGEPRLNLPGPDLSARELGAMLDAWPGPAALVIAASASGGFADALAGPSRVVVTATKSGFERNEARFGAAFARAFAGEAADTDKDGALSLFEAYSFADREVVREYESANKLRTEHARITDSTLARQFVFAAPGSIVSAAASDTALARLLERRRTLEAEVAKLRGRRATMDSVSYETTLEDLLVELAETSQAIRQRTGRTP
jgi:hypothetical protein